MGDGGGGAVSSLPKTNMSSAKVAQEVGVDPSLMSKAKMEASKNGVMMKV